ncbi:peptidylprolyl isomerase [Candidatus Babeliales bacterium]|nr:peptidylprolyl isomerase [Candidatus Babeliales bacterium]
MKKWSTVLWVVFVAMALGSGVTLFFKSGPGLDDFQVATINGKKVSYANYRRSFNDVQERINSLREYARMIGISDEMLLKSLFGASDPYQMALDRCIKDELVDQVKDSLSIKIDPDYFKEEFLKLIPRNFIDQEGSLNMEAYQAYLGRLSTTPVEYEKNKENEIKRSLVERIVGASSYTPSYLLQEEFEESHAQKSFSVAEFALDSFLQKAKTNVPTDQQLMEFFEKRKDRYREPDKKKAWYCSISANEYAKNIDITEEAVQSFYEKNKSALFRIAPKIKVRRILVRVSADHMASEAMKKAQTIYEQAKQKPNEFADLAKLHSEDKESAKNGGLIDFFSSGSYDRDFERAAFRLNEPGQISDIVRTASGYEIIQLVERVKASEKSLESVQEEIVNTLKAKRALTKLKSDLEIMHQKAKTDDNAVEAFVKSLGLNKKDSVWLTKDDAEIKNVTGVLAKHLFSRGEKQAKTGYFFNNGVYVIYQLVDSQASFIPKFADIKSTVLEHYYKNTAKNDLKAVIKEIKFGVFNKKASFAQLAKKHGIKLIDTGLVKKGDTISSLKNAGELTAEMFGLTSPEQLLQHKNKDVYYLAQVQEVKPFDKEEYLKTQAKMGSEQKIMNNAQQMRAFIASLQRNATIDVDKTVLKGQQGS